MSDLLIRNIKQLVMATNNPPSKVGGFAMRSLPIQENAFLLIENGLIKDWGSMDKCPTYNGTILDATGQYILPTWCDSHTHLVYAASREQEFVYRIEGLSYEEIAARGGGILNSANKLRATDEQQLFEDAYKRLHQVIKQGTGAIEIKSGYGLSYESELKMLRVIRRLKEVSPIPIKATFLGAHALPKEFKADRKGYLDLIVNKLLPTIADEGLADYIDAFCERGFFSVDETKRIIDAGTQYGLTAKIHTNQFHCSGAIRMAVEHGALSVDHLEVINDDDINALKDAKTIAALLPSAAFFINAHYQPARKMIDAGLPVALATDYNPGTSPSGNMSFVITLACVKMGMLPSEAIMASTLNGAYAMELEKELGSISIGKKANLIMTKKIPSLAYIPYDFGNSVVDKVFINGEVY